MSVDAITEPVPTPILETPMPKRASDRWNLLTVLGVAILGVVLIKVHTSLRNYAFDAAYIHLRIVRNLLGCGVPYFNCGERVMSTPSPMWEFFLAALYRLFGGTLKVVSILNAVVSLLTAIVWTSAFEAFTGPRGKKYRSLVVLGMLGILSTSSIGLMETPLALLFLGGAVSLLTRNRLEGFAVLGAALFLRSELLIYVPLFFVIAVVHRKIPGFLVGFFLTLGALFPLLYVLHHFDSPIPHTIAAKLKVFNLPFRHSVEDVVSIFFGSFDSTAKFLYGALALGSMILAWRFRRARRPVSATLEQIEPYQIGLIGGGIVILLSYLAQRVPILPWFEPLYLAPISIGIMALAVRHTRPWSVILSVLLISPPLYRLYRDVEAGFGHPGRYSDFVHGALSRKLVRVGRELSDRYPGASLMTTQIGGLGWGFKGRILDAGGAATPRALDFHPMKTPEERADGSWVAIPPGFVAEALPDLVVSVDVFADAFARSEIASSYRRGREPLFEEKDALRSRGRRPWNAKKLLTFVRRGLAPKPLAPEVGTGAIAGKNGVRAGTSDGVGGQVADPLPSSPL